MARNIDESLLPSIFSEIIRKRVQQYIEGDLDKYIKKEIDKIVTGILADLQVDSSLYKDMLRYETQLVVKAIYNGKNVEQNQSIDFPKNNH